MFVIYLRFFAVNVGIVYVYYAFYQQVDAESYGGTWELTKEGMMGAFALFLVCPPVNRGTHTHTHTHTISNK